jgi:hypothetical protein
LPNGKTVFESQINKNPEKYYNEDILRAIDIAAKKEFCYGRDEAQQAMDHLAELDEELGLNESN